MRFPSIRDLSYAFDRELPKYFSRDEVHRIIDSCTNPLHRLMIRFLWMTGSRVSEMLEFKPSDINDYAGVLRILTLKQRKKGKGVLRHRIVPVEKLLLNELDDHIKLKGIQGDQRIFNVTRQAVHKMIVSICSKAGIDRPRAHPHTFRHSFAINCILQRVPLQVLKKWLGHSDIKNVMIYSQILAEDTRDFMKDLEF